MEVYMQDLPSGLDGQGLTTQLTPIITNTLCITEWTCRKDRGKPFGTVTFLHNDQGTKFLKKHGVIRMANQRERGKLKILGNFVRCRVSKHTPDEFLLKAMIKTAQDQKLQAEEEKLSPNDKKVSFELREFSCGHYEYLNGRLAYSPDIKWPITKGVARFARDSLIILYEAIRVEIPYRTIDEIVVSSVLRIPILTLTLWEAPRIFQIDAELGEVELIFELSSRMSKLGVSELNSGAKRAPRVRLSHLPHPSADHAAILGQSLVYSVQVSPVEFNSRLQRLKQKEKLKISYHDLPNVLYGQTSMMDGMRRINALLDEYQNNSLIPFDILFQFHALVQNGYLLPQTVEILLKRLHKSARIPSSKGSLGSQFHGNYRQTVGASGISHANNASATTASFPISARAVKKLFSQIPFPGPSVEASTFNPDEIWSYLEGNEKEIRYGTAKELISERASQSLVMVYKVQVTPTRITLLGPEPEAKNRILRKFPDHVGYFARVQFCEEDGQDLFFNSKVSLELVWHRFKHILLEGIRIAGRDYRFLGFSHSSLRAHSVWFMAPFTDHDGISQDYFRVISLLGRFNKIYSPSKCAARIGQAFSETPFSIDLVSIGARIEFISDVKSKNGDRVFSDGVGTLSRSLMEAIHVSLPKNRNTTTCFQIRWAGAKGMLSLDDTLKGMVMRIRPSMIKFESKDVRYLEICDMGNRPIPLVLNRQMIKILEDMGVAREWFLEVQNRELERLRMITAQIHNTVTFLKRQKVAEQINFSKFIRRLHELGIDYKKDKFLCSVVETIVLREVRLLKHKARIPVEKGATLFGVMDEFGFLEEDEIFVTFEEEKLYRKRGIHINLHNRLVLITRSPALHPGDIQVRTVVVPPDDHPLRSLSNCVVFSQKGKRDLPSQLSGGDLDGDIYNIIWDELAVNSSKAEFAPADYPLVTPLNIDREVRWEDMTNFFVEFMATDQLGVIATKHLILADRKNAGTVDEECKLLAEMHSTGVDYSKSGIPIDMNKLRRLTTTKYRPDFMAPAPPAKIVDKTEIEFESAKAPELDDEDDESGPGHVYYTSNKILGILHRAIDEKKIWRSDIQQFVSLTGPSVWEELLQYINYKCDELGHVDWEAALDEARRIRDAYDDAVWTATMEYSDNFTKGLSELEVFTGYIFNKTGAQTRRQRDRSVRLKDDYDAIARWVESMIRKKKVGHRDSDDDDDDDDSDSGADLDDYGSENRHHESTPLELSIACLHVGITKPKSFGRNKDDFQSFKIVAAQCVLTELEFALQRKEFAMGAAIVAAESRVPRRGVPL
ncbi:RdRP-domain-containing protein [Daldinia caldariorum]|uniref:RdRP-domain-containing protein n=1 Tax=Daldinia caldariorum TaxID=326644 RepID=UPI002007C606|nr:RdRP-domain-containing protein [Daldinia caldariorum]KAI1471036.1 RdRP-domain-containing protein [Daldinia caldariorum]